VNSPILKAAADLMDYDSKVLGRFATSRARDAAFDQLLRLAASYASRQKVSARNGSEPTARRSPVTEDIELRAYHIYLGRGGADGHDLDDWLQAERQVLDELKKDKVSLRLALAFGVLQGSPER
jgi:hypothetical protein